LPPLLYTMNVGDSDDEADDDGVDSFFDLVNQPPTNLNNVPPQKRLAAFAGE
jgi:hypothetical protein